MAEHQVETGAQPDGGSRASTQDASAAELVKQLTEQSAELARKEVELAKAEVTEKAKRTGVGAGMFGGAGLMAVAAFAALTACFILALNLVVAAWAAALIVAAAYGMLAGGLALSGRTNLQRGTPPAPQQAVESTKEDVAWVKDRARSARA
ncbi:MAG TPA: phage holin family protein [Acidimicrobiales bacterium]|nr:phage holin family protein [Acidimicrobiales bacterium]